MKRLLIGLTLLSSVSSFAQINTHELANSLYSGNQNNQEFTRKFFEIVESHKIKDPFLESKGPSTSGYSLDKIPFAFITDDEGDFVDLIIFNWTLPHFNELKLNRELTLSYGKDVYVLEKISKNTIATQGESNDELVNFSYILGANSMKKYFQLENPDSEVPDEFTDWKPHPAYMDRDHPIRIVLDDKFLPILSPRKELLFGVGDAANAMFESAGGFYNLIMGMMIHEIYHVHEINENLSRNRQARGNGEDYERLIERLREDKNLQTLYMTYMSLVFSIGKGLTQNNMIIVDEKLGELKLLISVLKSDYVNAWKYIWVYEYTEGFAEYTSAVSMVESNITSLEKQVSLQIKDEGNNFPYRTGSLAGLFMYYKLGKMPFENNEDQYESPWEIILRTSKIKESTKSLNEIIDNNPIDPDLKADEIRKVIEYLESKVADAL